MDQNKLQIFNDSRFGEIRSLIINGDPWFIGKDVADILGYSNPQKAIRDHVKDKHKTVNESFTVNGTAPILIDEAGLYSLVMRSKLEAAEDFQEWVTSEVLPAIRKTGTYGAGDHPLEYRLKAAEILSKCPKTNRAVVAHVLNIYIPDDLLFNRKTNPLNEFLGEIKDTITTKTPVKELWGKYLVWCYERVCNPISRIDFSRKLRSYFGGEIKAVKINRKTERILIL